MADAAVLAIDLFAIDQFIDVAIGFERGLEQPAPHFRAMHFDQQLGAVLEPDDHHAAVARRCAPSELLRFQKSDRRAALGEHASGRDAGVSAANYDDVGFGGEFTGRWLERLSSGRPV